MDELWGALNEGRTGIDRIGAFNPSGFPAQIGAEVPAYKVNKHVPKSHRKATKVMARDIEQAVIAADAAARDANLVTPGVDPAAGDDPTLCSYPSPRMGCQIGAGLIAADLDELTLAFAEAVNDSGEFDMHKWGAEGMQHLTPLWLLKYLPNMLACHLTIVHQTQGPSNTITCGEAASGLSVGESMRVIQRDAADMCFCGGAESKLNPLTFHRQNTLGWLSTQNDQPATASRPFDVNASGAVIGEGGGVLVIEEAAAAEARGARAHAQLAGFGATHTIYPEGKGLRPDPEGKAIAAAMRAALNDAGVQPGEVDLIIPTASAIPTWDTAEANAINTVFGDQASTIRVWSSTPFVGTCGAGKGGIDLAVAAKCLSEQVVPATINCDEPIAGLNAASAPAGPATLNNVLVVSTGLGGQNVALLLKKA
jgi:3-oxoacyl-[acyl-carrier-protein] synthase II